MPRSWQGHTQVKPEANGAPPRRRVRVLGAQIDAMDMACAITTLSQWAERHESRTVCICNAHSSVTCTQDEAFNQAVNGADLALPDGAPVAWLMRRLGITQQARVPGPDLMLEYCAHAAGKGEGIYLYGSSPATLGLLQTALLARFPGLKIVGAHSPPFRSLSAEEDGRRRRPDQRVRCRHRVGEPGLSQAREVDGGAPRPGERGDGGRGRRV